MFSVFSICSQWHPQIWGQIIPGEHRAGNQPVLNPAHPTTRTQWVPQSCLWSPRYPPLHLCSAITHSAWVSVAAHSKVSCTSGSFHQCSPFLTYSSFSRGEEDELKRGAFLLLPPRPHSLDFCWAGWAGALHVLPQKHGHRPHRKVPTNPQP